MKRLCLIITLFLFNTAYVWAMPNIEIQALFSVKIVALIDGQRRVISVGETSTEGIKLLGVNTSRAILEI